jgi:hypothetical protein
MSKSILPGRRMHVDFDRHRAYVDTQYYICYKEMFGKNEI